jgi:hypothetical protein
MRTAASGSVISVGPKHCLSKLRSRAPTSAHRTICLPSSCKKGVPALLLFVICRLCGDPARHTTTNCTSVPSSVSCMSSAHSSLRSTKLDRTPSSQSSSRAAVSRLSLAGTTYLSPRRSRPCSTSTCVLVVVAAISDTDPTSAGDAAVGYSARPTRAGRPRRHDQARSDHEIVWRMSPWSSFVTHVVSASQTSSSTRSK